MPLVLDVGNTSITFALYEKGRRRKFGHVLHEDLGRRAPEWLKMSGGPLDVAVSSVVPAVTAELKRRFKAPAARLWIAGENLDVPVKHHYRRPADLGIDRRVNIYGALRIYKAPMLVIDFGTAVTMDYVSAKGVFEGGLIIPGPELSFRALINRAALISSKSRLPRRARSFPGNSTKDCMAAGILHGYGAMTDGLIEEYRRKYGKFQVIATGGFAGILKPYSRRLDVLDPHLTVTAVFLLFQEQLKRQISLAGKPK